LTRLANQLPHLEQLHDALHRHEIAAEARRQELEHAHERCRGLAERCWALATTVCDVPALQLQGTIESLIDQAKRVLGLVHERIEIGARHHALTVESEDLQRQAQSLEAIDNERTRRVSRCTSLETA